jgi:hypothetical protein
MEKDENKHTTLENINKKKLQGKNPGSFKNTKVHKFYLVRNVRIGLCFLGYLRYLDANTRTNKDIEYSSKNNIKKFL